MDAQMDTIAHGAPAADVEDEVVIHAHTALAGGEAENELASTIEALLFLSPDPLSVSELAEAAQADEPDIQAALGTLAGRYVPGSRGIVLRELAGGYTFATDPTTEDAARRLFSRLASPDAANPDVAHD